MHADAGNAGYELMCGTNDTSGNDTDENGGGYGGCQRVGKQHVVNKVQLLDVRRQRKSRCKRCSITMVPEQSARRASLGKVVISASGEARLA